MKVRLKTVYEAVQYRCRRPMKGVTELVRVSFDADLPSEVVDEAHFRDKTSGVSLALLDGDWVLQGGGKSFVLPDEQFKSLYEETKE